MNSNAVWALRHLENAIKEGNAYLGGTILPHSMSKLYDEFLPTILAFKNEEIDINELEKKFNDLVEEAIYTGPK
jgi:hypothetical protein